MEGVVKHHRTIESYVRALREAGLDLVDYVDWTVPTSALGQRPEWRVERNVPFFLLLRADRR